MTDPVPLPYGKSFESLPVTSGQSLTVIHPGPFPKEDGSRIVADALNGPGVGRTKAALPLSAGRTVCLIPDMTRRAAVSVYLPVLLENAMAAGLAPERLEIIVALGIHRPMTDREIRDHVGPWVHDRFRVSNHDCDATGGNVLIGTTARGIPVEINRKVAEADALLVTGSVTYHYFAGYGGGRKAILPGVCSRASCESHHKLVVKWRRQEIDGTIAAGVLEGNPVDEEMREAAAMVPPVFSLNVVTSPDGRIVAAAAGDPDGSHAAACDQCDRYYKRSLSSLSRLVIASAGGWPRDINFVQAHKGYLSACRAVAPGGVVILLAKCEDGTGHPDFLSWFRRCRNDRTWLEQLDGNYQINGQTAYSTWLRSRKIKTILVSGLADEDVRDMGMTPAGSLKLALQTAERELGGLPDPVVLPNAADMLVNVAGK